jgi:hypothetical protein
MASGFTALLEAAGNSSMTAEERLKLVEKLKAGAPGFFKNFNLPTDQKIFAALMKMYKADVDVAFHPEIFKTIDSKYNGDFASFGEMMYSKSMFTSLERLNKMLETEEASIKKNGNFTKKFSKTLASDPAFEVMTSFFDVYKEKILPNRTMLNNEISRLDRTWMTAQREVMSEKKFYPDANSTLRITYGKAKGYEPRDGVSYNYFTTLDGIMEKEDPADEDFIVPARLKELYKKKDFGQYADKDGKLRVAFSASNHTTGGNSGSPVLNGEGHLIGTNFDRNWEGTMSDIMYDPDRVRNISVDVRYTLFVIDKYAGAGYLLKEMKIIPADKPSVKAEVKLENVLPVKEKAVPVKRNVSN